MIGKRCECDDISNFIQSLSDRPVAPFFQGGRGALYLERKTANQIENSPRFVLMRIDILGDEIRSIRLKRRGIKSRSPSVKVLASFISCSLAVLHFSKLTLRKPQGLITQDVFIQQYNLTIFIIPNYHQGLLHNFPRGIINIQTCLKSSFYTCCSMPGINGRVKNFVNILILLQTSSNILVTPKDTNAQIFNKLETNTSIIVVYPMLKYII